ncbi:HAD-IB family phosphatase [Longimicrobium sp.]|uniref:HAD-IB family phosphatase n=1 Tax=Longimicrobium sp. TaxID=2029185 RepID=UPI002E319C40|nr:HAD-IB family phosphatase [Longimicrobium sp.]HEX6040420.1 HAD-IB family phosphatase [Longimicrobium sp.]
MSGFASVVFDCDSTLVAVEGIDELSGPFRDEIQKLTDLAMDGAVPLEEVYGRRMDIIRPTRAQLDAVAREYVRTLVPHARETVAALRWLGKTVRILSGGLLPAVVAVAEALGLTADDVAAVGISFDADDEYAGFETDSLLARGGGKALAVRAWNLPRPSLLVGDGATDLEARPAVDAFAAFAGVIERAVVVAGADYVVRERSLAPILALACSAEDRARLADSPWAGLLAEAGETR